MMDTMSMTRRRSLSLTVAVKDTDRTSTLVPIPKHARPWNKYLKDISDHKPRKSITLSNPTEEEFRRIRQWAVEKRKHEEHELKRRRQKEALLEQYQRVLHEKSIQERHSRLLEEVQQRQEKRTRMKEEREEAQKQYILMRTHSRQMPLLHETMPTEFRNALRRMEDASLELYNQKIKPFKTVRPNAIISTNVLQQMGKFPDEDQILAPFELKRPSLNATYSIRWQSWRRVTDPGTKRTQSSVTLPPIQTPAQKNVDEDKTVTKAAKQVDSSSAVKQISTQTNAASDSHVQERPPSLEVRHEAKLEEDAMYVQPTQSGPDPEADEINTIKDSSSQPVGPIEDNATEIDNVPSKEEDQSIELANEQSEAEEPPEPSEDVEVAEIDHTAAIEISDESTT